MKTTRTIMTALAATALLAAGSGLFACKKKEPETIKIGAILPLTGEIAAYGKEGKNAIDLAVTELNNKGGINGANVEVVFEDSKGDPKTGVAAINKLIISDGVPIVIGPFSSGVTLAVAPVAEEKKVVVLSPVSSAPAISNAGDYIFRNSTTDEYEGPVMARYAVKDLGLKKFAVFVINNEYGQGIGGVFQGEINRLGAGVCLAETFNANAVDFKTQLLKIKTERPDAVYLVGLKEVPDILKQMDELGIETQLLSSVMFENPENVIGNRSAEGAFYTYPSFDSKSGKGTSVNFIKDYEKTYGEKPGIIAALSYDAVNIAVLAIKNGGYNSDGIKNALYGIKGYPGVTGDTTFDEYGDVVKPIGIKKVVDGKFTWLLHDYK